MRWVDSARRCSVSVRPFMEPSARFLIVAVFAVWALEPEAASTGPQPTEGSTFTVASVKPNASGKVAVSRHLSPGRFDARNFSLRQLIAIAYDVGTLRVVDGPDWVDSDKFDIVATFDSAAADDETSRLEGLSEGPRIDGDDWKRVRSMLRNLLAQRFHLRIRGEQVELAHYALVVANPNEPLRETVRPSTTDCEAYREEMRRLGVPKAVPTGPHCGFRHLFRARSYQASAGAATMSELAKFLQPIVGGIVSDQTGLVGRFDFDFTFALDRSLRPFTDQEIGSSAGEPSGDELSVFVALEDELGLKLMSRRGPVAVHKIDHVERLSPN